MVESVSKIDGDRHVQHARLDPVDLQVDLRRVGVEGREDARHGRILGSPGHELVGGRENARHRRRVAVLQLHAETAGIAEAAHRRRRDGDDEGLGDRLHLLDDGGDELRARLPALRVPLREIGKDREHGGLVRRIGEGGAGEAGESDHVLDAGDAAQLLLGLEHDLVRARQGGSLRKLDDDDGVALVLDGDEALRDGAEHEHGRGEKGGVDQEHEEAALEEHVATVRA